MKIEKEVYLSIDNECTCPWCGGKHALVLNDSRKKDSGEIVFTTIFRCDTCDDKKLFGYWVTK